MTKYHREEVRSVPPGYHIRTVKAGDHRVLVAFPPGPRKTGSGVVVEVLHPRGENPGCLKRYANPAELILMGGNPMPRTSRSNPYSSLSRTEKLAFGRLGLGKKQLQTEADIEKARRQVEQNERFRNRLPNPSGCGADTENAEAARDLFDRFTERPLPSEHCTILDEPHMPTGDYTLLGKLILLGVKPQPGGTTNYVQEISFPGKDIRVVADPSGRPIYFAGEGQELTEEDLSIFGASSESRISVGECRYIVYEAAKWHKAVEPSARGKRAEWQHQFGDEGGYPPYLLYDRSMQRCLLQGGTYHVEGAGIVN
jgi:hypothetical protein